MRKRTLNFNFLIADLVSQINIGTLRKLRFIRVIKTRTTLRLLTLLYKYGVIRTFFIEHAYVRIYLKYAYGQSISKLNLISKPSKRQRWNLKVLAKKYSKHNFSGFYIVSTQKGITSIEYCLLYSRLSGEVIMQVTI